MSDSPSFAEKVAKLADLFYKEAKKAKKKSKLPETSFIFPKSHPKVKSGDHFPIDTEGRARNALSQVNKYKKVPKWWNGTQVSELVNAVTRAVKKRYPGIEISEKSKKPGKD